jgi:hypothetical protein
MASLTAAPGEVPEQHCRAGPPTDQTSDSPRTWLRRLLDGTTETGGLRSDGDDQETTSSKSWRRRHQCARHPHRGAVRRCRMMRRDLMPLVGGQQSAFNVATESFKALGENLLMALGHRAAGPACPQPDTDKPSLRRQICQSSLVPAVNPRRNAAAGRTSRRLRYRSDHKQQFVRSGSDVFDDESPEPMTAILLRDAAHGPGKLHQH